MNSNYMSKNYPRSYVRDIPVEEKKVKGNAMTIAPIMPPAIMKNTSLLNEKSTLASWGFISVTILMPAIVIGILKDIRIG